MSTDPFDDRSRRKRGQPLFALMFLGIVLFLLSQLGSQTRWTDDTAFVAQPGFWPGIGVIGMALFTALHFWHLPRRRLRRDDWLEARLWARALEFVVWFLVYVYAVPRIGYLPASVIFMGVLTWRLGYRSRAMLALGAAFGALVVVVFKTVLQVRIPGGDLYEVMPDVVRSFLIVNF